MFTYLGQKIKDENLKGSACMEINLRKTIGALKAFNSIPENIDNIFDFVPALEIMARYNWHRMEVTDLTLMLGDSTKNVSFKKRRSEPGNEDPIQEDFEEDL